VREFQAFVEQAKKRLLILRAAVSRQGLMLLPSNRFEALGGDRKGQFSIRINQQRRICFEWPEKGPIYPFHPGKILADELQELDMSAAELTWQLHVPSNRIYQLISGKRAMTAAISMRLEQWPGVEAAFWINPQNSYKLDLSTEKSGEKIKKTVQRRLSSSCVQAFELCHQ
jgi:addiction module HigA family antidote